MVVSKKVYFPVAMVITLGKLPRVFIPEITMDQLPFILLCFNGECVREDVLKILC